MSDTVLPPDEAPRELPIGYRFALSCLLYSRTQTGTQAVTETHAFSNEIDAYVAALQAVVTDPTTLDQHRARLTRYDVDILRRLAGAPRGHVRYTIIRGATDTLILSSAVLEESADEADRKKTRTRRTTDPRGGRTAGHHHFVFTHSEHASALRGLYAPVLEKLAHGYAQHERTVSQALGAPFVLSTRLAGATVDVIDHAVNEDLLRRELEQKQDAFLDLYGEWKRTGTAEVEKQLRELAEEIRVLDPSFTFDVLRTKARPEG